MSINYEKVKWAETPYKYANPSNLDQMDSGIKSACDSVDSLEPRASQTEKELWDIKVGGGGKNLNSYPYWETTNTQNGLTITDNGDGTITVNGTATANTSFNCHTRKQGEKNDLVIQNGKYKLVGCPSGGGSTTYGVYVSRTKNNTYDVIGYDFGGGCEVTLNGDDFSDTEVNVQPYIQIKGGVTVNNLVFKPMLTTDLNANYNSWEPYTPYNVREIGYASDDVKWLGWSVPHNMPLKNYTDANGVFHQRVGRVNLGDLDWLYSNDGFFYYLLSNKASGNTNLYTPKYPTSSASVSAMPNKHIKGHPTSNYIYIKDSTYTDATQFRNSLSNTYLYYELSSEVTYAEGKELIPKIGIDGLTFSVSGNTLSISNGTKTWTLT